MVIDNDAFAEERDICPKCGGFPVGDCTLCGGAGTVIKAIAESYTASGQKVVKDIALEAEEALTRGRKTLRAESDFYRGHKDKGSY
ncbi:MAG TPA: hypothetical protein VJI74_01300 [Candidatus Paceibacterota bacterium]